MKIENGFGYKINHFKILPEYPNYLIHRSGFVLNKNTGQKIHETDNKGYKKVAVRNKFNKSRNISIHRLVALAWVPNPDPEKNTVVNHIDGVPWNNLYTNLEWTTYSGNNYHAVNNNLRPDNMACKIRNVETGEVNTFPSIAQACEFMGLRKDTHLTQLAKKKFGSLIGYKYEFRLQSDNRPWECKVGADSQSVGRYRVEVTYPNGNKEFVFGTRSMLKKFQLYDKKYGSGIPGLVKFAREKLKDHKFHVEDSYEKHTVVTKRNTRLSYIRPVMAINGHKTLRFSSISKCSKHFDVDPDVIKLRLNSDRNFNGWLFKDI